MTSSSTDLRRQQIRPLETIAPNVIIIRRDGKHLLLGSVVTETGTGISVLTETHPTKDEVGRLNIPSFQVANDGCLMPDEARMRCRIGILVHNDISFGVLPERDFS